MLVDVETLVGGSGSSSSDCQETPRERREHSGMRDMRVPGALLPRPCYTPTFIFPQGWTDGQRCGAPPLSSAPQRLLPLTASCCLLVACPELGARNQAS
ncbi:hypothetical protein NDU88_010377 [Pleurodeles waltl]|uniref:Uncharacterized protein n=1 Tax=Pleurodeles waltl TaxID=8319 RepID=A0AAV7PY50_PLEWA|nr:hypothetical protein NDU88_010377 [Pleurodeles waltl]